jgi:hypothetical protein
MYAGAGMLMQAAGGGGARPVAGRFEAGLPALEAGSGRDSALRAVR